MKARLPELTALGAAEAIRAREITAADYVAGLISRIEEREPEVEAWHFFNPAQALDQARSLDARADLAVLPLAGVAVGVKDIIDTVDMPTENGTPLDAGRRPAADAAVIRLLKEAGAVIMGKTRHDRACLHEPVENAQPA